MRLLHSASFIFVLLTLAGCATTPPLQGALPISAAGQNYGLAKSEIVARTDHMTQHLNAEQSVVYYQNLGGGGVGLGLMGPLGIAANVKMIEGNTMADVERITGKIVISPEAAFQQAASNVAFSIKDSAGPEDVKVTPFVLVSKTNDSTLNLSAVVLLAGVDGRDQWLRRYQYQLNGDYTLDDLSALDSFSNSALQNEAVRGYAVLLRHILNETDAAIEAEQRITFKSPYLTPRWEFELMGSLVGERDDRVWVRLPLTVVAIDPEHLEYQLTGTGP